MTVAFTGAVLAGSAGVAVAVGVLGRSGVDGLAGVVFVGMTFEPWRDRMLAASSQRRCSTVARLGPPSFLLAPKVAFDLVDRGAVGERRGASAYGAKLMLQAVLATSARTAIKAR